MGFGYLAGDRPKVSYKMQGVGFCKLGLIEILNCSTDPVYYIRRRGHDSIIN